MLKRIAVCLVVVSVTVLAGCATKREVLLASNTPPTQIKTAAMTQEDGNSPEMDAILKQDLAKRGVDVKDALPAKTRKVESADVIVSYVDVWRWDLVMYLYSLNVSIFDAKSGNAIVTGRWNNSAFHGFQKPEDVVKELMDEMFGKMGVTAPTKTAESTAPAKAKAN